MTGIRDRWMARCGCVFVGLAVAHLCTKHANNLADVPDPVRERQESIACNGSGVLGGEDV